MAKSFNLMILTPERKFFSGKVESLTVQSIGGQLTILADHIPMVTALSVGSVTIRTPEEIVTAFHSEGFMEVLADQTTVFAQACEWPHEIDINRAEEARKRAESILSREKNANSIARSKIALSRALMRIRVRSRIEKL
ncbi:MAG: ATP synthase F1 subunit epsilon [Christensenellales bacterium]|jgi:F-type H+-transporting ATPase subunit epsilon